MEKIGTYDSQIHMCLRVCNHICWACVWVQSARARDDAVSYRTEQLTIST